MSAVAYRTEASANRLSETGFVSHVPISMLLEPELADKALTGDMEGRLLQLATMAANQRDTVMMLTENQRRMDELRAGALVRARSSYLSFLPSSLSLLLFSSERRSKRN